MLVEAALLKAIGYCGKQKTLADLIGEDPDKISYWLNRGKRIPFHSAVAIEKATQGKVSRYDLAPYARINRKPMNKQTPLADDTKRLTISERVAIGLSMEQSLGNRRGVRNDVLSTKKRTQLRRICAQVEPTIPEPDLELLCVKGKTSQLVAKETGFSSRDTYLRAKKVVTAGIFQLVEAMDKKNISIATAAALAELPPAEQESLLAKGKKEILALIQKKSHPQTSPASLLAFLKDERLKTAEQQHLMPLRLVLLSLLLQCDTSGHFPWQSDERDDLLTFVPLQIEAIQEQLIDLGWLKKTQKDQKMMGHLNQMEIRLWQKFVL